MESVLLMGLHTRPAVFSAKALGYRVYSVDYFGSIDVKEKAAISRSIVKQTKNISMGRISENYSDAKLLELAEDIEADKTILTTTIDTKRQTLGTKPKRMKQIKDKWKQIQKIRRLGIDTPRSEIAGSKQEISEIANELGFPIILKPVRGEGGKRILLVRNSSEIPEVKEPCIVQEYVRGRPISISTLSTKNDSMALSSSVQILGARFLNQEGFAYCGSIVPYDCNSNAMRAAEEISLAFGVLGWNGVDFVERDGRPVFMEINPRFQGTYDCVELVYGVNLVDAHIKACEGELIPYRNPLGYSVRSTLYAGERSRVTGNLKGLSRDVPCKDVIVEEGEPITTVVTWNTNRREAILENKRHARYIYNRFLTKVR